MDDGGAQAQDAAGAVGGNVLGHAMDGGAQAGADAAVLEQARAVADRRSLDSPRPTGFEMRDGFFICPKGISPATSDNANDVSKIAFAMYFFLVLQHAVTAIANMNNEPSTIAEWLEVYALGYDYFWKGEYN